jgi:hypothetical protein
MAAPCPHLRRNVVDLANMAVGRRGIRKVAVSKNARYVITKLVRKEKKNIRFDVLEGAEQKDLLKYQKGFVRSGSVFARKGSRVSICARKHSGVTCTKIKCFKETYYSVHI